jgi:hypothetical protein
VKLLIKQKKNNKNKQRKKMQQITKTAEKLTKKNIINRISDVPGGVSLVLSTLVPGNAVLEGTPLSAPSSGIRSVCKQAQILTGSSTTVFRVKAGMHNFKVGDFIMRIAGGLAYAVTAVATNVGAVNAADITAKYANTGDLYDTITIGTAVESATVGGYIYQAAAQSASTTSALLLAADTIIKEAFVVPAAASQVIWMADAYIRADVVEGCIGSLYLATLDVNEVKY